MNYLLHRRAAQIGRRLSAHLPDCGSGADPQRTRLLDIGCGSGHNAAALRAWRPALEVVEIDVANLKVIGPPPVLFDGRALPFADGAFDVALLAFVLHYCREPTELLSEIARVVRGRLLLLQSTYAGLVAARLLQAREWSQGRGAFAVAQRLGFVPAGPCSMSPRRYFDRPQLEQMVRAAGWSVRYRQEERWPLTRLSRDLYVLEKE